MEPFLQRLPVDALWGVGPVTARRLRAHGIERLVDVRSIDDEALGRMVGGLAGWLRQLAQGVDDRPVVANRETKSSGTETTFPQDLTDIAVIRREVAAMAEQAAQWLTRRQLFARTVTLKVRYEDFVTITRSASAPPTREASGLVARAVELLDRTEAGRRPVRLLGVSVHNLGREETPPGSAIAASPPLRLPFDD
jgi:DNA polymerase-4